MFSVNDTNKIVKELKNLLKQDVSKDKKDPEKLAYRERFKIEIEIYKLKTRDLTKCESVIKPSNIWKR